MSESQKQKGWKEAKTLEELYCDYEDATYRKSPKIARTKMWDEKWVPVSVADAEMQKLADYDEIIRKSNAEIHRAVVQLLKAELDGLKQKLREETQKLTDILASPNMGYEGRKMKLIAIKAWEITFRKLLGVKEGDK
jgi:hypothetical protein